MSTNQITLTYDQLRAIARYEMTFRNVLGDRSFEDTDFTWPQPYAYKLEDLRCAVENMKKINPSNADFSDDWFWPITRLSEAFCLDDIRWADDDVIPEGFSHPPCIKLTESDFFDVVWTDLDDEWEEGNSEEALDLDYDQILELIDRYFRNQDKPIEEREFDHWDKNNNEWYGHHPARP